MHKSKRYRRGWREVLIPFTLLFLFAVLLSLVFSAPALADPPGRIGRVAWLSEAGGLTLDNRGRGESFRPPVNQPLTSGDVLSTDGDTRAEIQIGSMTLRLDAGTSLELSRVDDEQVSVFLRNGSSIVKLASPDTAREFELNVPNGRITGDLAGSDSAIFRVDANDNGSSATAYIGSLHVSANDADFNIRAGERADIWFAGQTRYRLATPASDDFMQWSAARDRRPVASVSSRYVSPEMTGAEDLDTWGDWADSPEYGPIWTPRSVAIDWAPYRSGHWAWVAPWGWSWVGHEPWGFAPFHYGRWVQNRGRWSWVPGAHVARPVYAPALVAWRPDPGVSISLSFGRAPTSGWFPLAPREVYVPVHRSSPDYVRRINRTHVARIDNVNVIVGNPRQVHRDLPRAEPPRPFVHNPHENRDWRPAPNPREFHHGDDDRRRHDRHREVRENRREQPPERPQVKSRASAKLQHPDMAFFQMSQQPRQPAKMEHRPDAPRRAPPEEERRKGRQHPNKDEKR